MHQAIIFLLIAKRTEYDAAPQKESKNKKTLERFVAALLAIT
jgi:hypothetical protein